MPTLPRKSKSRQTNKIHDPYYDSPRWRRTRSYVLLINPFCYKCDKSGIVTQARTCDHKKPRRWFPELEWETDNMGGLCKGCDDKKRQIESTITSREDATEKLIKAGYL